MRSYTTDLAMPRAWLASVGEPQRKASTVSRRGTGSAFITLPTSSQNSNRSAVEGEISWAASGTASLSRSSGRPS